MLIIRFTTIILSILLSFSSQTQAQPHPPSSKQPCYQAAVSTSQIEATDVGLDILRKGGNAIDAAVAVGYALAVVEPCCGNIGGGGFMLVQLANEPGKTHFLNFREKAPAALSRQAFLDKDGQFQPELAKQGYLAVGVPGTVMGLNTALERWGTMSRKQVMAGAIKLARHGYLLNDTNAEFLQSAEKAIAQSPHAKSIFMRNGKLLPSGQRLIQTDLANTLAKISQYGTPVFYEGEIAKTLVAASQAHGGVLTEHDLKNYTVTEEKPVHCHYRDVDIISAPPPSSGGVTLCEMLHILEHYDLTCKQCPAASRAHLMIEAMRYSFADRNAQLGDPAFVNNPVTQILSPKHIAAIQKTIAVTQATSSDLVCPLLQKPSESHNTTHYTIIDKAGNAVAVTYSLNSYYGAKVIPDSLGFFLNNHINDFTIDPSSNIYGLKQGEANTLAGNKRPLSSMTPTFVLKNGDIQLALGTPGGPTIITTLLQVLVNYLDRQNTLTDAVNKPRFHMQCQPDTVYMEEGVFEPDIAAQLREMGHTLTVGSVYHTPQWGAVAAVERRVESKSGKQCLYPVIDSRRPYGAAKGLS